MSKYAYVEDGIVKGVYDTLPESWKNVSNFHLIDKKRLIDFGFYLVEEPTLPSYNPETTRLTAPEYTFTGSSVIEQVTLEPRPPKVRNLEVEWMDARAKRDRLILEIEWRYNRSLRQNRLGMKASDDIESLDRYIQALADITTKFSDPQDIVWPVYGE